MTSAVEIWDMRKAEALLRGLGDGSGTVRACWVVVFIMDLVVAPERGPSFGRILSSTMSKFSFAVLLAQNRKRIGPAMNNNIRKKKIKRTAPAVKKAWACDTAARFGKSQECSAAKPG
jgi:hypothetical protein